MSEEVICQNCGHTCHCVPSVPYDNCPDGQCKEEECGCETCTHEG
jgi:hypothetical protein